MRRFHCSEIEEIRVEKVTDALRLDQTYVRGLIAPVSKDRRPSPSASGLDTRHEAFAIHHLRNESQGPHVNHEQSRRKD